MEKEIKKQLERFMAGLTSVEEEQALAKYFRTHDVDDEWEAYKEMFAWFDNGMPEEEAKPLQKTRQWRKIATIVTVAAAAALIIICVLPKTAHYTTVKQSTAYTKVNDIKPVFNADSTIKDTVKVAEPIKKQEKSIRRRYMYSPAPPKTYYAMNSNDSRYREDDMKVEEELQKIYTRQEELLQTIYMQSEQQECAIRQMLATMDYEADCATEEEIY